MAEPSTQPRPSQNPQPTAKPGSISQPASRGSLQPTQTNPVKSQPPSRGSLQPTQTNPVKSSVATLQATQQDGKSSISLASMAKNGLSPQLDLKALLAKVNPSSNCPSPNGGNISIRSIRLRPSLVQLCVPILATDPKILELLNLVPTPIRPLVIAKLPLNLPLELCAQSIFEDEYWKRKAIKQWEICDPAHHGRSWKQLFFERNLVDALENFDATEHDGIELIKMMELCKPYVHNLRLRQLPSHLNTTIIFRLLGRQLSSLKLEYGWKNAKMNYEPTKFGMKISDCFAFSASLSMTTTLTNLDLSSNLLNDEKIEILLKGMLKNPILVKMNLSHNRIGDVGVAKLSEYLMSESCVLTSLDLGDNRFSVDGAKSLGEVLRNNNGLFDLKLGYNDLHDAGGQAIFDSLATNTNLQKLVLRSCYLGEESASALGRLINSSKCSLIYLDVSSNPIGPKGGSILRDSLEGGKAPSFLDLRLSGLESESEDAIIDGVRSRNEKDITESHFKAMIFQA